MEVNVDQICPRKADSCQTECKRYGRFQDRKERCHGRGRKGKTKACPCAKSPCQGPGACCAASTQSLYSAFCGYILAPITHGIQCFLHLVLSATLYFL